MRSPRFPILIFFIFILLASCATIQDPEKVERERKASAVSIFIEQGEGFSARGDYKKAIPEFKAALRIDPLNEQAKGELKTAQKKLKIQRDSLLRSLVQLRRNGSQMYDHKEFVKAGRNWKEAIDIYQAYNDPELEKQLPFKIEEIDGQLNELLRLLVDKGVMLYRNGELNPAIMAWQEVLLIDPQQRDALDYINKARTKLDTLEKLSTSQ